MFHAAAANADSLIRAATWTLFALSGATVLYLQLVARAPYGRHARSGFGPPVPARLAWLVFESPNLLVPAFHAALTRQPRPTARAYAILLFFLAHYVHRALVYPLARLPRTATPMPLAVVAAATAFTTFNALLQAAACRQPPPGAGRAWRFGAGFVCAAVAMTCNIALDARLLRLRARRAAQDDAAVDLPRGGAFDVVASPNMTAEAVEWSCWAVAAWSLPAAAFATYVWCNLVPRALAHRDDYRRRFGSRFRPRWAIVPGLV